MKGLVRSVHSRTGFPKCVLQFPSDLPALFLHEEVTHRNLSPVRPENQAAWVPLDPRRLKPDLQPSPFKIPSFCWRASPLFDRNYISLDRDNLDVVSPALAEVKRDAQKGKLCTREGQNWPKPQGGKTAVSYTHLRAHETLR